MTNYFPDNDPEQYRTRDIRRSKAKDSKNLFVLVDKPREKSSKKLVIPLVATAVVIVAAVVTVIILSQNRGEGNQNVNPAGNELTTADGLDASDFDKQRADEQLKLADLLDTIAEEDWPYANSVWKTIFPNYLSDCELHKYYTASGTLSTHIKTFPLSEEECAAKAAEYLNKCQENS